MAKIPISEKNMRELSPDRDFPTPTPVRTRYGILSSPRSGSTLLGRILYETRMAGDPQEYFNPPLLALERQRSDNPALSLNEFMKLMERRRTSANGMFGIKMHYAQLLGAFGTQKPTNNIVNYLRRFDKLIWIRRRDRLRQAISQAIAASTQVWSSEDPRFVRDPEVNLRPDQCVRALRLVCDDDAGWALLIKNAGLQVLEVWYEDLVADYSRQFSNIFGHLGIDQDVVAIPAQPLERQSGELNERLRQELLVYLGVTNGA